MDTLLTEAGKTLIAQYGIAGIVIVGLLYLVLAMRAELRDTRKAHKVEILEKDKLIYQLQEARLEEVKIGLTIAKENQTTLAALTSALRKTS